MSITNFEPCEKCVDVHKIDWCSYCIAKYLRTINLVRVESDDPRFQKLGPCQLCGDYQKPCRCSLEKEILKLQKFKNDVIKICSVKSHTFKVYDLILDLIEKETVDLIDKITTKKSE